MFHKRNVRKYIVGLSRTEHAREDRNSMVVNKPTHFIIDKTMKLATEAAMAPAGEEILELSL